MDEGLSTPIRNSSLSIRSMAIGIQKAATCSSGSLRDLERQPERIGEGSCRTSTPNSSHESRPGHGGRGSKQPSALTVLGSGTDDDIDNSQSSPENDPTSSFNLSTRNTARTPVSSMRSFQEEREGFQGPTLPPVDKGKDAYLYLGAAFLAEMMVWGFPVTYGVILDYYLQSPIGQTSSAKTLLPLVGTLSSGIMYCSAPLVTFLLNRWPSLKKWTHWAGAAVCSVSLLLAAFATKPWQLVLTQGIGYAIGGSFVFYVTSNHLPEWFVKKRGMASGVRFAGTATGGLLFPFIFQAVLDKWGVRVLLISSAIGVSTLSSIFLPFVHGRLPSGGGSSSSSSPNHPNNNSYPRQSPSSQKWWKSKGPYLFMMATFLQAAAYFTPSLLLPTFARSLHFSASAGSSTLVAVNASGLVSRLLLGMLADKMEQPRLLTSVTTIGSALAAFLIWGLAGAASLVALLIFAIIFGATAGGWTSMWMAIIAEICGDDPAISNNIFSSFMFMRGIGNVAAAPISSWLLKQPISSISPRLGYGVNGGQWGALIFFVGSCFSLIGLEESVLWIRDLRKRHE